MQKANYANVETDPVNMAESIENSIFQAAAEALAAVNPNPKDASGSSHGCFNKKRSRGEEASGKDHSDSSSSDDEDEFDDEIEILTLDFQWNTTMIHLIPQKVSILHEAS